jgi:hypothetical protein
MSMTLAEAALSLVGSPFRLHGRDPQTGIDCVGLVAAAIDRTGGEVSAPRGYSMRATDIGQFLGCAAASGLVPAAAAADGEVVLVAVHSLQPHLLVRVPSGHVHAHAALGRVTVLPDPLPWPVIRQWRLATSKD